MDKILIEFLKDLDPMARINAKMMCQCKANTKAEREQGKKYWLMLNVHQRMNLRVLALTINN